MGTNYNVSNTGAVRAGTTTNNVTIDSTGLSLTGSAKKYKTHVVSASEFADGANPAASIVLNNVCPLRSFEAAINEQIVYALTMPNDYEEGTDIDFWFRWAPSSANAGDVNWRLQYLITNDTDVLTGALTQISNITTAPGVNAELGTTALFNITGTSITRDSIIQIRPNRAASSGGDTYPDDAYISSVVMRYTSNALGEDI